MAEITPTLYDKYITTGMDKAQGLVQGQTAANYTPYTSSAANAPVNTQMYDYQANAPLQQINAPNYKMTAGAAPTYQGLMGNDYNALQTALTQPGQQAAQNAYNAGTQNLTNTMGGRGLYGSSVMQQQQTQGLDREYQNTLASNANAAASQRYQMEQAGLQNQNQFGLDAYGQRLAEQKDINAYNAQETVGLRAQNSEAAKFGAMNADSLNQYNNLKYNADKQYSEQMNNWQNQQNYEKNFLYPQAQQAFNQSQQEMLLNQALALSGQGAPLAAAQQNNILGQQQMAAQQATARQQSTNDLIGSGIGALGSIYGKNYDAINTSVGGLLS